MSLYTKLAQFGPGIEPIVTGHQYTAASDTQVGVLGNTERILSSILGTLTVLGSIFFMIYFFAAAIMWLSSGSDSSKLTKARDQMVQAILGLIILVSSYTIIGLIGQVVGIDILNVSDQIENLLAL